jgi:hypothetical protein
VSIVIASTVELAGNVAGCSWHCIESIRDTRLGGLSVEGETEIGCGSKIPHEVTGRSYVFHIPLDCGAREERCYVMSGPVAKRTEPTVAVFSLLVLIITAARDLNPLAVVSEPGYIQTCQSGREGIRCSAPERYRACGPGDCDRC